MPLNFIVSASKRKNYRSYINTSLIFFHWRSPVRRDRELRSVFFIDLFHQWYSYAYRLHSKPYRYLKHLIFTRYIRFWKVWLFLLLRPYLHTYVHDGQESCIRGRSSSHMARNKTWTSRLRAEYRRKDDEASVYPPEACQATGYDGPWLLVSVGEPKRSSSTETRRNPSIETSLLPRPRNLCSVVYTPCLILRTSDPVRLLAESCWAESGLPPPEWQSAFDRGDKRLSWCPRRSHRSSPGTCDKTSEDMIRSLGRWRYSCRWGTLATEVNISRLSLLPLFVEMIFTSRPLRPDWKE